MPWVITRLCVDCVDTACVNICPVECIYAPAEGGRFANQLYINPDECVDCGACEPECPWGAIFEQSATPAVFQEDVALNRAPIESPDQFEVARFTASPPPTPEQVAANKHKWGAAENLMSDRMAREYRHAPSKR